MFLVECWNETLGRRFDTITAEHTRKMDRRANISVIYIRIDSPDRAGTPLSSLVCLIILIRVVSGLACCGIVERGLVRAMLAMSGNDGML